MDQATSLLWNAPFDRSTVTMLCRILEDGWAEIEIRCRSRRVSDKTGRMNLADAYWPWPGQASANVPGDHLGALAD